MSIFIFIQSCPNNVIKNNFDRVSMIMTNYSNVFENISDVTQHLKEEILTQGLK